MIELVRSQPPQRWDEAVAGLATWRLYHQAAWLDFLEASQPGLTRVCYEIRHHDKLAGYLPGFAVSKGPIKIFGSPLPGWTTPYLGPVADDLPCGQLLRAIGQRLRRDGFHHAEIRHPSLDPASAEQAGFRLQQFVTYIAPIPGTPEQILSKFGRSCRKAVRRAQRHRLRVECTEDPAFIDHYYAQLEKVFAKHGRRPTYPKKRVELLFEHLQGRLLATWVVHEEQVIATRIDLLGKTWMHSFGSASSPETLDLHPNELARYHVMCQAAERGLRWYDLTGDGTYKAKFGAERTAVYAYLLTSTPLLLARKAFAMAHRWKTSLVGGS